MNGWNPPPTQPPPKPPPAPPRPDIYEVQKSVNPRMWTMSKEILVNEEDYEEAKIAQDKWMSLVKSFLDHPNPLDDDDFNEWIADEFLRIYADFLIDKSMYYQRAEENRLKT